MHRKNVLQPIGDVLFISKLVVSDDPLFTAMKALGANAENDENHEKSTIGSTITLFDRATTYPAFDHVRRLD
jgi:hypothetical protein